ncbi:MAG: hypothetical protein R2813_08430 [Flavobacteriales bacterium]
MRKTIYFRVVLDHDKDVFRDIEISTDDTFLSLHDMIQEAFGFDNSQMASFYVSNEDWEKGQEITLMSVQDPEESGQPIWLMDEIKLNNIIFELGQKLIYVFDFMLMWCFYIDVIKVTDVEENVILPRITQSYGDAPDQYSKSGEISFDSNEIEPEIEDDTSEDELEELFRQMGDHDLN